MQSVVLFFLLFRSLKFPDYRHRLSERYGFCKGKVAPEGILLHSVSVGETLTAIPLVVALRRLYPSFPIIITTVTPTGSERVISAFGKGVYHVYLPYDFPCAMNKFFNTVRPKLVIVMETEIWPNMIFALHKRNIPLILANARISERSNKNYRKINKFMCCLLDKVTLVAAQNEENAKRFISLGLKPNRLSITGNLKFDFSITPELIDRAMKLRHQWAPCRRVWIACSTHNGEEIIILKAHHKLLKIFPNLLLIIAPRHPNRFKTVQKMVQKAGFNFILRSSSQIPSKITQVIVGDTMGELILLYGVADLAFVGGSLIKKGGHNPLEPAAHKIPIIMGPYTFNFKDICSKLQEANGLITVTDIDSIVKEVSNLLNNETYRLQCGRQAIKVFYQNKGALSRLLYLLKPYLNS